MSRRLLHIQRLSSAPVVTHWPHVALAIALIGLIGITGTGRAGTPSDSTHAGQPLRTISLVGVSSPGFGGASGWNESPWRAGVSQVRSRKSPLGAVLRSLGGTLVPAGVGLLMLQGQRPAADWIGGIALASGLIVGPAVGHFYAENGDQAWRGIAVRGAAGGGFGLTAVLIAASLDGNYLGTEDEGSEVAGVAALVTLLASGLALGVRTLYDIAEADDAARAYNAEAGLTVRPRVNPVQRRVGLSLQWAF